MACAALRYLLHDVSDLHGIPCRGILAKPMDESLSLERTFAVCTGVQKAMAASWGGAHCRRGLSNITSSLGLWNWGLPCTSSSWGLPCTSSRRLCQVLSSPCQHIQCLGSTLYVMPEASNNVWL